LTGILMEYEGKFVMAIIRIHDFIKWG